MVKKRNKKEEKKKKTNWYNKIIEQAKESLFVASLWVVGATIIFTGAVIASIIFIIPFVTDIFHCSPQFKKNANTYNILILPFDRKEDELQKELKLEKTVLDRYQDMIENESLDIQVIYDDTKYPESNEEAVQICKERSADLLIFGDYYESSSKTEIKYVIANLQRTKFLKRRSQILDIPSLIYITDGKLLKDADYIIFFTLALKQFQRTKDFEKCLFYLNKIPLPAQNLKMLAMLYMFKGTCYLFLDNFDKAIPQYTNAIMYDSTNAELFCNRGTSFAEMGNNDEGLKDYTKAIEINPNYYIAYCNRGSTFARMGVYQAALKDFHTALKLDSNQVHAYLRLGGTYLHLKYFDSSIIFFDKALKLSNNPLLSLSYLGKGLCLSELGYDSLAITQFSNGINADPSSSTLYYGRAFSYAKILDNTNAINDYTKCISIDDSDVVCYLNRGNVFYNLKKYTEALGDYLKVIELDTNRKDIYYYFIGVCHTIMKKYNDALIYFNKSIKFDPNSESYSGRGYCYMQIHNYKLALYDFDKACFLNPKNSIAFCYRGYAHSNLRKFTLALNDYAVSEKLDSTNPLLYHYRGDTYIKAKKYALAIRDLERAIDLDSTFLSRATPLLNEAKGKLQK